MFTLNKSAMQISNTNYRNRTTSYPRFCGHSGFEKLPFKYGISNRIITETRLFRDYTSIKYCIDYLNKVFKGVKKNIVVGACSTGEDVFTLKMLLGKKPAKITAFDLGTETIKKAKSGIIELDVPADEKSKKYIESLNMDAYNDKFLSGKENLNNVEMHLKKLFEENFEQIFPKKELIHKLKEKLEKIFFTSFAEFDKKFFRMKTMDNSCEFKSGNITDIENFMPLKKNQHLFTFKNAIYHLLTDNNYCGRESIEPKKAREILNKIFTNVNKSLCKNGLFVMGEFENYQHESMHLVTKSLLKNGFLPIRMPEREYLNVWKKVREVN